ncbi:pilus assembly protein [Agaribacterium haliotis]|uniref:pilus assembly protein n=1 Tax=Agaribacterium haliotis TaxID=2013869 RepID=UPI00130475DA|nr:PilC/PilY family type IV pilus protein [Agaribacterium haliotis]
MRINAVFLTLCLLLLAQPVMSIQANQLSNLPLSLGEQVKPNVLFLLDDSGSMESEIRLTPGALAITDYRLHEKTGSDDERNIGAAYNKYDTWTVAEQSNGPDRCYASHRELLRLCKGYNALAFDPQLSYKPWFGFTDADINAALLYPTEKGPDKVANTQTVDLQALPSGGSLFSVDPLQRGYGYVRWDDAAKLGSFEQGECGELSGFSDVKIDNSHFMPVGLMSQKEKQNYANWFVYHRKPRFVVTASMLDLIHQTNLRVGLATINNDADVATEIKDTVDNVGLATAHKQALLEAIVELGQNKMTPLRRSLENAGRYYWGKSVDKSFVSDSTAPPSPILSAQEGGACQHNYTVLITDAAANEGDVPRYEGDYGNADGDINQPYAGYPYADAYSGSLADIAMHFYAADMSALANKVRSKNPADNNPGQHMLTYSIAFALPGAITGPLPSATSSSDGKISWINVPLTWPRPAVTAEDKSAVDDLLHAALNGRGSFYAALSPKAVQAGLHAMVESILNHSELASAPAVLNASSCKYGSYIYQSSFFPQHWSGDLRAFMLSGGKNTAATGEPLFSAAELLKNRLAAPQLGHTDRRIVTYNGVKGVAFRAPKNLNTLSENELSAAQLADLRFGQVAEQKYIEAIVAWIRGDNSDTRFRARSGAYVLGDIVHSIPQFVAKPEQPYPNHIESASVPYQAFVTANIGRPGIIYVGANDGMLHAFDADTGEELFAYIPGLVFSDKNKRGLHWLADPEYTHKAYVDATPTIADVVIDRQWRTYLVGALGAGGRGLYVLDITNPESFSSEQQVARAIKNEFIDDKLGYGFSRPQLTKLNNGEWAAIFGNGYGNDAESGGDGQAYLYVLYLDGRAESDGNRSFRRIATGLGPASNSACADIKKCNGLSSPTLIDLNSDAIVDRVYAGDLYGNMWAFDLSSPDASQWQVAHTKNGKPQPLFSTCNSNGPCMSADQPITVAPAVVGHAEKGAADTEPNTFVLFGTGQYLTQADINNDHTQSFYGVWDSGVGGLSPNNLQRQTISQASVAIPYRRLSNHAVDYSKAKGWRMDLPASGERVFVNPVAVGELILFASWSPNNEKCERGGQGHLMAAGIFSGTTPSFQVFNYDVAQASVTLDQLPLDLLFSDSKAFVPGRDGDINVVETLVSPKTKSRRVNWSILR